MLYKIPDDSRGYKPFDMVFLNQVDAFVVIKYPEEFVFIDIEAFLEERDYGVEKSLHVLKAIEIAKIHVPL